MAKKNREGRSTVLSVEQIEELFNELSPKHKLLFAICYYTGCRCGEALKLDRKDITKNRIYFRKENTKTKSSRDVAIAPKLQKIFNEVGLPRTGLLFPSRLNERVPMTIQGANKTLKQACDLLGIEGVSTHSFRRSNMTRLYESGKSIKVIQAWTGHKDLTSLSSYLEVSDEEVDSAIDVL